MGNENNFSWLLILSLGALTSRGPRSTAPSEQRDNGGKYRQKRKMSAVPITFFKIKPQTLLYRENSLIFCYTENLPFCHRTVYPRSQEWKEPGKLTSFRFPLNEETLFHLVSHLAWWQEAHCFVRHCLLAVSPQLFIWPLTLSSKLTLSTSPSWPQIRCRSMEEPEPFMTHSCWNSIHLSLLSVLEPSPRSRGCSSLSPPLPKCS